ncbi:MAG: hypothetical protein PHR68_05415 [Candidatus Gracilibacteria bacterium]|nr:hypothetical protein [Candidatus Gracilibacteria bacterium]
MIIILLLIILVFGFFSLAPYVPTKGKDLERINNILREAPWENFYEIGCGDGKVSYFIAKNNPEKTVIGIELSPLFYIISKIRYFLNPLKNLKIIYGNALNSDFSKYDIFYVFGLEETLENKLKPKLEKEMKNGAKIISYVFEIKSWKGKKTVYKENKDVLSIFVYEK